MSFLRTICFWSIAIAFIAVDSVQASTRRPQSTSDNFIVIKTEVDNLNGVHKFRIFDKKKRISYEIQTNVGLIVTDIASLNTVIGGTNALIAISCRSLLCIERFKSDIAVEIELGRETKDMIGRKIYLDKVDRPPTDYADTLRHRMLMIDGGSLSEINSSIIFSARNFRHFALQDSVIMRPDDYAAVYTVNSRASQIQYAKIAIANIGLRPFLAKDVQVFSRVDSGGVLMRAKGVKPGFGVNDLDNWTKYFRNPTISDGFFVLDVERRLVRKFDSPRKFYCGKIFSVEYKNYKVDINEFIANLDDFGVFKSYSYSNDNGKVIRRRGLCICEAEEIQECNFSKEIDKLISSNNIFTKIDGEGVHMYNIGSENHLEQYVLRMNGLFSKASIDQYRNQMIMIQFEDLE